MIMRAEVFLAALRAFEPASLTAITGGARAMILAPHPDDETLGCGGLIAACCAAGEPPLVVILTDGTGSHPGSLTHPPDELARVRRMEAQTAVGELGLAADRVVFLDFPDTALPAEGDVVDRVAALLTRHACGTLFAPLISDPHCDHVAAAHIARAAAERTGSRLRYYPVWTWMLAPERTLEMEIPRGWRLDVQDHLAAKQAAIAAHVSQYGVLIADSPEGFRLPPALLDACGQPFESFVQG